MKKAKTPRAGAPQGAKRSISATRLQLKPIPGTVLAMLDRPGYGRSTAGAAAKAEYATLQRKFEAPAALSPRAYGSRGNSSPAAQAMKARPGYGSNVGPGAVTADGGNDRKTLQRKIEAPPALSPRAYGGGRELSGTAQTMMMRPGYGAAAPASVGESEAVGEQASVRHAVDAPAALSPRAYGTTQGLPQPLQAMMARPGYLPYSRPAAGNNPSAPEQTTVQRKIDAPLALSPRAYAGTLPQAVQAIMARPGYWFTAPVMERGTASVAGERPARQPVDAPAALSPRAYAAAFGRT